MGKGQVAGAINGGNIDNFLAQLDLMDLKGTGKMVLEFHLT